MLNYRTCLRNSHHILKEDNGKITCRMLNTYSIRPWSRIRHRHSRECGNPLPSSLDSCIRRNDGLMTKAVLYKSVKIRPFQQAVIQGMNTRRRDCFGISQHLSSQWQVQATTRRWENYTIQRGFCSLVSAAAVVVFMSVLVVMIMVIVFGFSSRWQLSD